MIGKDSRELVITQIKNILNGKNKAENLKILQGQLVQTGKVPNSEINKLVVLRSNLDDFNVNYLCLIYKTLKEFNDELRPVEELFTPIEIKDADQFMIKRQNDSYPLIFENVIKTTENGKEYKFFITIQQLNNLSTNGILKIVEGMQRESDTVFYRGKIENHVKYNDRVSRKIMSIMEDRKYHPTDDIKIHYIGNDYSVIDNTIQINSGDLILLDGQHRVRGVEYLLQKYPDIYMIFSVNLSFGSEEYAQDIIEQHERRQPINRQALNAMKQTEQNSVFVDFSTDRLIEKEYKFVDTYERERNNGGFIVMSDMIDSIKRYYKPEDLKLKERREISNWLVKFFDGMYLEFEDDITDFINVKKKKWNVRSYAYDGFIYMSRVLYKLDIDDKTKLEMIPEILKTIDFSSEIKSSNKQRECTNIIKEAVDNYVK